jgi:Rps23 Pro-64 3,4-dihydroxylase Tpa1-like proline 4-hydroxylase
MTKLVDKATAQPRLAALMDRAIDTLAGILDDPAVPAAERAELALRLLALGMNGGSPDAGPASGTNPDAILLPMQFVSIPDFLPPELHAMAADTALEMREKFTASTITTDAADFRQSHVLYDDSFPALRDAMVREITAVMPSVFAGLARPAFEPAHLELQMSAHGDGDYFRPHSDAASPQIARREITFVYYFLARQPCGFSGGSLRLYQTWDTLPQRHDPAQFHEVAPQDNMILFFDSHLMHEVTPLSVPSGDFADGRFTLNGWLSR